MNTKQTYKSTLRACYLGYITQSIVVNLAPIFFVIFKDSYGLSTSQIGTIVFTLFIVQLLIDIISAGAIDRIGYRACAIAAHIFAGAGILLLGILPRVMDNFAGIMIAEIIAAVGAGIIEVLISPIVDLLPAESKSSSMSLLHAFYCWGQVAVVALSTITLVVIGTEYWYYIPMAWAIVPTVGAVLFSFVPIPKPAAGGEESKPKKFLHTKFFVFAAFVMFAAAMSELSMSQWASYFAERGLGVNKVMGDLLGPCMFGVFMGVGRTLYGIHGGKLKLSAALTWCSVICFGGYLLTVFSPIPMLSLVGCAVTGFGVSLMWPGTLSLASEKIPGGGTSLFALLALFGDLGCSVGPWLTGVVSDGVSDMPLIESLSKSLEVGIDQLALKAGLLVIAVFPIMAAVAIRLINGKNSKK